MERRARPRREFRRSRRADERVSLLGADVDLTRPEEVLHHIARSIEEGRPFVVANHNSHSLYLLRRDPEFARFYAEADLTVISRETSHEEIVEEVLGRIADHVMPPDTDAAPPAQPSSEPAE